MTEILFARLPVNLTDPGQSITGGSNTGDIFYRNSSGLISALGIGAPGQVLTVASGLPSWASGGGGSITLVQNTDGTLTITGGSGPTVTASLALGHANTWTATQTFSPSIVSPLVIGGTTASSTLTLESTSGAGTTDNIFFNTGSQIEAMRIDSSQRVLINQPTAINALDVKGFIGTQSGGVRFYPQAGGTGSWVTLAFDGNELTSTWPITPSADNTNALGSASMRWGNLFAAQGTLGNTVGSAPTNTGTLRLTTVGDFTSNSGLEFMGSTTGSGYGWRILSNDRLSGNVPLAFGMRSASVTWTEFLTLRMDANAMDFFAGTSGTNSTGTDFSLRGSPGTGTGAGGNLKFATSPAGGSSGSTQNAQVERMRIDSSGAVNIGNQGASLNDPFGLKPALQVSASDGQSVIDPAIDIRRFGANAFGADLMLTKSRTNTLGAVGSVQSGDGLGNIIGIGYDVSVGPVLQSAAQISFLADAAPTAGSIPGRITFQTSASGSANPTEAMRIDSNQNITIGTGALATNATNGFLYLDSCAGAPTGTPTSYTGRVPVVVDTTNTKFMGYYGGAWHALGGGGGGTPGGVNHSVQFNQSSAFQGLLLPPQQMLFGGSVGAKVLCATIPVSVASGSATSGGNQTTSVDAPAGSTIIVFLQSTAVNDTISSVTDSATGGSNTYTLIQASAVASAPNCCIAYCVNTAHDLPVGGSFTASTVSASNWQFMGAMVLTGSIVGLVGSSSTNSGTAGTSASTSTGALSSAPAVVFGFMNLNNTNVPNEQASGFRDAAGAHFLAGQQEVTATTSVTYSHTFASSVYAMATAAFGLAYADPQTVYPLNNSDVWPSDNGQLIVKSASYPVAGGSYGLAFGPNTPNAADAGSSFPMIWGQGQGPLSFGFSGNDAIFSIGVGNGFNLFSGANANWGGLTVFNVAGPNNTAQLRFGLDGAGSPNAYFALGSPTANTAPDIFLNRQAAGVFGFGSTTTNTAGWFSYVGALKNTAAQNFASTVTLGTVTGLSVSVLAGRVYGFEAYLPVTAGLNAGGIQVAIAGTCTATAIQQDSVVFCNNTIVGQAQSTTKGAVLSTVIGGAATGYVMITGTITVNAAGTLLVQAAQNTSNATATTIGRGARFHVYDT